MPFAIQTDEEVLHRARGRGLGLLTEGQYTITNRRVAGVFTRRINLFGAGTETRWVYLNLLWGVKEERHLPRLPFLLGLLLTIAGIATVIFLVGIPLLS